MESDTVSIDMKKTGERMKCLCEERGISVKDIQEKLRIGAFQSIYNWFAGKTLPSLDNMYRLSKLLQVPIDDMIVDNINLICFDWKQYLGEVPKYLFVYYSCLSGKI